MNLTKIIAIVTVAIIALSGCTKSTKKENDKKMHAKGHHWTYSGKEGPAHWGDLSKDYHACKAGKSQSPISISKTSKVKAPVLKFNYKATPLNVVNNGHTLQVNYKPGSTLTIGKDTYKLLQFHFHTPSEHKRYGKNRPMEVHFVHINDKKELAVVGIFMRLGRANKLFAQILKNAPKAKGTNDVKDAMVNGKGLHSSAMKTYFNYSGSLTTPPCSEGVRWFVMKNSVRVSKAQVAAFKKFFKMNARSVQALNGRKINQNK